MSFRKPRADSKLLNLPEEQQAKLVDWLLGGMPYHTARELVAKEFGVTVGIASFTGFWQEVCTPHLLRKRSVARETADEMAEEAAARPARFDAATIEAIRQKAFEISLNPLSNPDDVKALFSLVLKKEDQDLKREQVDVAKRRVAVLERREEKAKEVLKNTAMTPEERDAHMRRIFGLK